MASFLQVAFLQQVQVNILYRLHGAVMCRIDPELRILRYFIGIADAGELRDLAAPRLGVQALAVAGLAYLQRGGHVDLDEGTLLLDHLAHGAAGAVVGSDGGADGDAAVLGDLAGDEADTADVEVAVCLGETQFAGQVLAHDVAVQQGHGPAAGLHQLGVDDLGEGGLARTGQAGEEQGEALPAARREHAAQFAHHLGVAEPFRDVVSQREVALQLCVGVFAAVQSFLLDPGDRQETVLARYVALCLDREHLDLQFLLVLAQQFLGGVRRVEISTSLTPTLSRRERGFSACSWRGRIGVLGTHDQVGTAIVLVHDGVPQGFARAGHAHGQGQQRQRGQVVGKVAADGLVAVYPRVIVQVARLGHAHGRVQQDVPPDVLGRPQADLALQAVHGLAGLEGHHLAPAHLGEQGAQFLGRVPQGLEFVVHRQLDALQGATDVGVLHLFVEIAHTGVPVRGGAVHGLGFATLVRLPDIPHLEHGGHEALGVAQGDAQAGLEFAGEGGGYVQHDGHGPEGTVGQAHVVQHTVVRRLVQEAFQGREAPVQQQLQVAGLALGQGQGGKVPGDLLEMFGLLVLHQPADQPPPVGRDIKLHRNPRLSDHYYKQGKRPQRLILGLTWPGVKGPLAPVDAGWEVHRPLGVGLKPDLHRGIVRGGDPGGAGGASIRLS